jgi:hypothetical protein
MVTKTQQTTKNDGLPHGRFSTVPHNLAFMGIWWATEAHGDWHECLRHVVSTTYVIVSGEMGSTKTAVP